MTHREIETSLEWAGKVAATIGVESETVAVDVGGVVVLTPEQLSELFSALIARGQREAIAILRKKAMAAANADKPLTSTTFMMAASFLEKQ